MWKIIEEFPNYEVNELGQIRNIKSKRILKERPTNCGYARVRLWNHNVCKDYLIHRLVAFAFVDNLSSKPDVNHINGNKRDNRAENLEWCTKSENIRHAQNTGLKTYDTISIKVTATKDNQILNFKSYNEAGRYFNTCHETIRKAVINGWNTFGYHWEIANN